MSTHTKLHVAVAVKSCAPRLKNHHQVSEFHAIPSTIKLSVKASNIGNSYLEKSCPEVTYLINA